jgi:uncharacterized coiled-coil DUF342 family protein
MLTDELPERIYIQAYEDGELQIWKYEATWCVDRVNDDDVVYVLEEARQRDELRLRLKDVTAAGDALGKEVDRLRKQIEQDTFCAYCGHKYPRGTPKFENQLLSEHIRQCAKHPMRKVEAERDELSYSYDRIREQFFPIQSERDELKRCCDRLLDSDAKWQRTTINLIVERDKLRERLEAARPYLEHSPWCKEVNTYRGKCGCGLAAVLRGEAAEAERDELQTQLKQETSRADYNHEQYSGWHKTAHDQAVELKTLREPLEVTQARIAELEALDDLEAERFSAFEEGT